MDGEIRFGALLLPSLGWRDLARCAAEIEDAGFDAVWIDDHIAHPARPGDPWLECFSALAAIAGVTETITLGPLVANIVLRRPAVLALQALSVAEISGRRLDLGIGSGYDPGDHAAVGEPVWPGPERARRFADAVRLVRQTLGDTVPLTVAGHGRRAIELAGQLGDTWVSFGGFGLAPATHLELTRRRIALLDEAAGGRPVARRLLCGSAGLTPGVWSSVDAFDEFVGRYHELGIDEFAFHWPPADTNPAADPAVVKRIVSRLTAAR